MSANQSNDSQGNTGTRDVTYNLISIIYHALQASETHAMYIADAEQNGDRELAQFFRDVKEENSRRADRAKQLLTKQLGRDQGQNQGQAASGS